jgi:hypothetical protein
MRWRGQHRRCEHRNGQASFLVNDIMISSQSVLRRKTWKERSPFRLSMSENHESTHFATGCKMEIEILAFARLFWALMRPILPGELQDERAMPPTLKDVAERAGVSRAAVSRTFTDGASVSVKMRKKVKKPPLSSVTVPMRWPRA